MAISDACPDAPPDGSVCDDTAKLLTGQKSGDRKVKLTVYHDARIGKAVPFPLLAWTDDHKCIGQLPALEIGTRKTNLRPGEEIPWMPLGLRNKCVSVMKRTVQSDMSGLGERGH